MLSEEKLQHLKDEWRTLVTESMTKAITAIEEYMPEAAEKHNILLALKGRLNEANQKNIMGVLSNEQLQLLYNKLRYDLLLFVDELEIEDFEANQEGGISFGTSPNQPGRGALLHKIPRQMSIGREEECIIRLAYERAVIANDLEITEEVEVKEVRISKVMQAELIDPNSEAAFSIRSYSDEEQFLQEGEYTEWKFFVTPLREGAFKLLLKLSVVELIDGIERLRNISWEEMIQIVAAAEEKVPAEFAASGISLAFDAGTSALPVEPGVEPEPSITQAESVANSGGPFIQDVIENYTPTPRAVPPAAPKPKHNTGARIRRMSIAATVVLAVGVALFVGLPFQTGIDQNPSKENKENPMSPSELDGPNKSKPSTSTEDKAWQKAQEQNTIGAYQKFIEIYPDSKKVEEARKNIKDLQ
ncbi:MAG: hypothetical protein MI974_31385 [Chitinophagales bacterium]|nr:hypothetical protein [Chitinophagales bacterium]